MTKLPFDLEKALSGKYKIVTRDNREVDYIHDTGLNIIVCHVKGSDSPFIYTKDGRINQGVEDAYDLFLVEEKKKGWVVYYRDEDYGFLGFRCDTIGAKDQTEELYKSNGTYLKTVEVEY